MSLIHELLKRSKQKNLDSLKAKQEVIKSIEKIEEKARK
jgi:hypothetical protein